MPRPTTYAEFRAEATLLNVSPLDQINYLANAEARFRDALGLPPTAIVSERSVADNAWSMMMADVTKKMKNES